MDDIMQWRVSPSYNKDFMLWLGLCTGRYRLGWAIERGLYDRALLMGLGSILRIQEAEKTKSKKQWNLAASISEQSIQGLKDQVWLGFSKSFTLFKASELTALQHQHWVRYLDLEVKAEWR